MPPFQRVPYIGMMYHLADMNLTHPEPRPIEIDTGVGVLDRSMAVLGAVEDGARSFTEIVVATGLPRATAHRLIRALERHGMLTSSERRLRLGPRILGLAATALREDPLREIAHPVLEDLSTQTGESAQLFVRDRDQRVCVDSVESSSELRTIVPIGAALPVTAGSAGKVFMAWTDEDDRERLIAQMRAPTAATPTGDVLRRQLRSIRRAGGATSVGERAPGVSSISAPVVDAHDDLRAVVSISGPERRIGRGSSDELVEAVARASRRLARALGA